MGETLRTSDTPDLIADELLQQQLHDAHAKHSSSLEAQYTTALLSLSWMEATRILLRDKRALREACLSLHSAQPDGEVRWYLYCSLALLNVRDKTPAGSYFKILSPKENSTTEVTAFIDLLADEINKKPDLVALVGKTLEAPEPPDSSQGIVSAIAQTMAFFVDDSGNSQLEQSSDTDDSGTISVLTGNEVAFRTLVLLAKMRQKGRRAMDGTGNELKEEFNNTNITETLLAQLKAAREKAGLSQGAVADAMGTARTNIIRLEKGRTNPTMETIERYAAAVGVQIEVSVTPV